MKNEKEFPEFPEFEESDGGPLGPIVVIVVIVVLLFVTFAHAGPPIVWAKVTEPMDSAYWSQVGHISFVDNECKSDHILPRVCLYRHLSKCRIITAVEPAKLDTRVILDLERMCTGWFPEPVLLRNRFSDPSYLPNQSPPSVDPAWRYQNKEGQ